MARKMNFVTCSLALMLLLLYRVVDATTFHTVNQCGYTVWPASWSSNDGGGGTELQSGGTWSLGVPAGWSGRLWGRTGCNFDSNGSGSCSSGDCTGGIVCQGSGQPATLFEITVDGSSNLDYYDLSRVDGFNLGMKVVPSNGGCATLDCPDSGCTDAYVNPDDQKTHSCGYGTDYTIYLCQ